MDEKVPRRQNRPGKEQDEFALRSHQRAVAAIEDGRFADQIVPVIVPQPKGEPLVVDRDEHPRPDTSLEALGRLKPAFREGGSVTAGNSSGINDGASATVVVDSELARKEGLKPLARVVGHATHAQAPSEFTTAPVGAIATLLTRTGWNAKQVDLYEINEAFAVVTMAAMKEHGLPHDKVNVHGGACALGHPIGASGARIVVTLIGALRKYGLRRGIASLCIGGGEATAMALELP